MQTQIIILIFLSYLVFICVTCYKFTYPQNCIVLMEEKCDSDENSLIEYYLTTSDRRSDAPVRLDPHRPQIPSSYNLNNSMKIVIHGYGAEHDTASPVLPEAYMEVPNTNVIFVNWRKLSGLPCYIGSVINTWQVGQCTAVLVTSLVDRGVPLDSIHLIGFSLGAHIVGIVGNIFSQVTRQKIERITGLDPALPLYATASFISEWILDEADANFVDIVHTNAGVFGRIRNTGHVDFYMNGGSTQRNCVDDPNPRLCSHLMGPIFFAESIKSKEGFWGYSCPSYFDYLFGRCAFTGENYLIDHRTALMGEHCPKHTRGIYFVDTNESPPYARGQLL